MPFDPAKKKKPYYAFCIHIAYFLTDVILVSSVFVF